MSETNEKVIVDTQTNEGEGESEVETITIPRKEYDEKVSTIGSMKRELKDLKKPKEETKETSTTNHKPDDALSQRVERIALKTAGIDHPDDVELARKTAQKWGMDIEEVLSDEDFKAKLDRQQSGRANVQATSGVKGGAGTSQAKNTPEYWIGKGQPPTPTDVPDRTVRQKIIRAMLNSSKGNGNMKFYND